jgi:hypothetical protein
MAKFRVLFTENGISFVIILYRKQQRKLSLYSTAGLSYGKSDITEKFEKRPNYGMYQSHATQS